MGTYPIRQLFIKLKEQLPSEAVLSTIIHYSFFSFQYSLKGKTRDHSRVLPLFFSYLS